MTDHSGNSIRSRGDCIEAFDSPRCRFYASRRKLVNKTTSKNSNNSAIASSFDSQDDFSTTSNSAFSPEPSTISLADSASEILRSSAVAVGQQQGREEIGQPTQVEALHNPSNPSSVFRIVDQLDRIIIPPPIELRGGSGMEISTDKAAVVDGSVSESIGDGDRSDNCLYPNSSSFGMKARRISPSGSLASNIENTEREQSKKPRRSRSYRDALKLRGMEAHDQIHAQNTQVIIYLGVMTCVFYAVLLYCLLGSASNHSDFI